MQMVIALLLVLLLAGCDGIGGLTDAEYVAKARDYLDKGELKAASIELKNALSKNRDNAEARWLLGRLYVTIGNGPAAEKELAKARELGVTADSIIPLLAKSLLLQKKYDAVLALEPGAVTLSRARAAVFSAHGRAYLAKREIDAAEEAFNAALKEEPKSAEALTGLAGVAAQRRSMEQAYRYLDKALEVDPRFAPAWSYLGDLKRFEKKLKEAVDAYGKAIENRRDNASDLLKRGLTQLQLGDIEQAEADAERLKALVPGNAEVKYLEGRVLLAQKKLPEAQEAFELALKSNKDDLGSYYFLGVSQYLQKDFDTAESNLSHFYARQSRFPPVRKLLALIKLRRGDDSGAIRLVAPLVSEKSSDVLAMNILASALLKQGRNDEAVRILRRVAELQPDSPDARLRLGVGLLQEGDKGAGVEALEEAIQLDPDLRRARVFLILSHLRDRSFDEAVKAAETFSRQHPDDPQAYNLLGLALLGRGEEKRAMEAFERALAVAPGYPAASHNLAALALLKGNEEQARSYYQDVLDNHKDHLPTLLRLAALNARAGARKKMIQVLERAVAAHPDAIKPRLLLARANLVLGKADRASSVMGELPSVRRNDPEVLSVQGQIQMALGQFRDAELTLRQLARLRPESAQAHFLLAQANAELGDAEKARAGVERALQLDPRHLAARIALARLLVMDGDFDRAREQLARLKEEASGNPDVMALDAVVQARMGNKAQALTTYRRLFEERPSTRNLLALAGFQWLQGDREGAIGLLESWITRHPDDTPALLGLANDYLNVDRVEDAVRLYRRVLELSPDNIVAINNLAWYLRDSDPQAALTYAEKAGVLAPDSPTVLDTLAEILLQQGEVERAERVNHRALVKRPGDPVLRFRRARILAAGGRREEAVTELNDLLKEGRSFRGREEAEAMRVQLKTGQ